MLCAREKQEERALRTLEAQNLAAKSGNRPRFKCSSSSSDRSSSSGGRSSFEGAHDIKRRLCCSNYNCRLVCCCSNNYIVQRSTQAAAAAVVEASAERLSSVGNEAAAAAMEEEEESRAKGNSFVQHIKQQQHKHQLTINTNTNKSHSMLIRASLFILATTTILVLTTSHSPLVNCDQQPQIHTFHHKRHNERHHLGQIHALSSAAKANWQKSPATIPIRAKRHLIEISSLANEKQKVEKFKSQDNSSSSSSSIESSTKVAAFAAKLEQWYKCHRSNNIEREVQLASGANYNLISGCQSHFDGHLCWPASRRNQEVRLACPQPLNVLQQQQQSSGSSSSTSQQQASASTQHSSIKSVINSIQINVAAAAAAGGQLNLTSMSNLTKLDKQQTTTSTAKSIKTQDQTDSNVQQTPTGTSSSSSSSASLAQKFAYRKCKAIGATTTDNRSLVEQLELQLLSQQQQQQQQQPSEPQSDKAEWQTEANYGECSLSYLAASTQQQQQDDKTTLQAPLDSRYFDPNDKWVNLDGEHDKQLFSSLIGELERIEGAIDPYSDPDLLEQWTLCIRNIMRAQSAQAEATGDQSGQHALKSGAWCPIIFDGWRCWPSTKAGEVAYVSCPSNQPGFSAERKAHKICTTNGTWYKHPMTDRYWSNYTTCVDTVDLAFRRRILNLYIIGNLISLVALSASLIIFISFKSLNCTRVTIHKNLFLSFITNNLMWIIWYTYVVNDANLLRENPVICQFWHILLHYFLVSNYFWMFCEGLYLHTLLVVAFVSEDKILKWFYMLGWITPIPITVAYAYHRSYDDYYTNFCWMEESPYNLILMAPIGISLLLNLIFLINIVRVLVTKLRANNSPDTHQTRKAVRATLILIPLLGLHYILTPFRPETKSEWEGIYETVAAVCTSFQGLCVAMLFCCCNGEVITVIKKKLKDTFNVKSRRNNNNASNNNNISNNNVRYSNSNNNFNYSNNNNNNNNFDARHAFGSGGQDASGNLKADKTLNSLISTSSLAQANDNNNFSNTQAQLLLDQQHNNNNHQQQLLQTTSSQLDHKRSDRTNSNNSNSSSLMTTVTGSPVNQNCRSQQQQHLCSGSAATSGERKLSSVSQSSNRSQQKQFNSIPLGGAQASTAQTEEQHKLLCAPTSNTIALSKGDHLDNHHHHHHHQHLNQHYNTSNDDDEEERVNLLHKHQPVVTLQASSLQTTTSFSIA